MATPTRTLRPSNFGGRSSPFLFNLFAEGLHWIVESYGLHCYHYLDDSFGLVPKGKGPATLTFFKAVCSALGIAVSSPKSTSGSQLEILGIFIDCPTATAWVTPVRISKLLNEINTILAVPLAEPAALQSLAGSSTLSLWYAP